MTFDRRGRGPRMLGMMGIVLGSALGFGAVTSPSPFWGQAVVVATVAALVVATAGAILCTPRAFWAGFAAVGWATLMLSSELWLSDRPDGYLAAVAAWRDLDPEGFQRESHRTGFGLPLFRQIAYPLVAVAQGVVGGLVALGLTRRYAGRTLGARLGPGLRWTLGGLGAAAATLAALRLPTSLWALAFIQAVYVALFALTLGGVVGRRRRSCGVASAVGFAALVLIVGDRSDRGSGRIAALAHDGFEWVYTSLYPRVLDPNWWPEDFFHYFASPPTATVDGPVGPVAKLLGGPPGLIRSTPAPSPGARFFSSPGPWDHSQHFHGFARAAEHLVALAVALLAGLVASTLVTLSRRRAAS